MVKLHALLMTASLLSAGSNAATSSDSLSSKGVLRVEGSFPYECPEGYRYISSQIATASYNQENARLCAAEPNGEQFRLGAAGTIRSGIQRCAVDTDSTSATDYNLCGKWNISNIEYHMTFCPGREYVTIPPEDVADNLELICDLVRANNATAKVGSFHGQAAMDGKVCKVSPYVQEIRTFNHICAFPNVTEVLGTPNNNEKACGPNHSLVNIEEATADNESYCNYLNKHNITQVRLSGGASMTAYGTNDCTFSYFDHSVIKSALCAPEKRL